MAIEDHFSILSRSFLEQHTARVNYRLHQPPSCRSNPRSGSPSSVRRILNGHRKEGWGSQTDCGGLCMASVGGKGGMQVSVDPRRPTPRSRSARVCSSGRGGGSSSCHTPLHKRSSLWPCVCED